MKLKTGKYYLTHNGFLGECRLVKMDGGHVVGAVLAFPFPSPDSDPADLKPPVVVLQVDYSPKGVPSLFLGGSSNSSSSFRQAFSPMYSEAQMLDQPFFEESGWKIKKRVKHITVAEAWDMFHDLNKFGKKLALGAINYEVIGLSDATRRTVFRGEAAVVAKPARQARVSYTYGACSKCGTPTVNGYCRNCSTNVNYSAGKKGRKGKKSSVYNSSTYFSTGASHYGQGRKFEREPLMTSIPD